MSPRVERRAFDAPTAALEAILAEIAVVGTESVPLHAGGGRCLAADAIADRDSPAVDVSAMDGFAVRSGELGAPLAIVGAVSIGRPPPDCPPRSAVRIVTGGALPAGADSVVRHEDAIEVEGRVSLRAGATVQPGAHIRRRGESARRGDVVLSAGHELTPAAVGTLAAFGVAQPLVRRLVRAAIVATGDELVEVGDTPTPFTVRDSNQAALHSLLARLPFVALLPPRRAVDDPESLRTSLGAALAEADLVVATGGVSMGERDLVPHALAELGVDVLFHRLPQRPGRPMLAGIAPGGRPVLALPGNPVSVLVTARRFVVAAARRLAGLPPERPRPTMLAADHDARLPLWWHRPVRLGDDGAAMVLPTRGSGDLASIAASDGFIELPPGASGRGPWPMWMW